MHRAKNSYHDATMYCNSKTFYDPYQCLKMMVHIISLNANSKILSYTVQGFCHIIFAKMFSNLSCMHWTNSVGIDTQ